MAMALSHRSGPRQWFAFFHKQDQKSIDAIESDLISEPSLIIDDNIIEELTDGCSGAVA